MAGSLLEVENLSKRFGGFVALDGINLSVAQGERVGLIGPNGSGKSTLVNCMCGTLQNETGTVQFDGHAMNGRGNWKLLAMPRCVRSWAARPSKAWPSKRTVPLSLRNVPHMQLTSVDLPEPFGPISPTRSPGCTDRLMSSNATNPPKRLPRFSTTSRGSAISALPAACWQTWQAVSARSAVRGRRRVRA